MLTEEVLGRPEGFNTVLQTGLAGALKNAVLRAIVSAVNHKVEGMGDVVKNGMTLPACAMRMWAMQWGDQSLGQRRPR